MENFAQPPAVEAAATSINWSFELLKIALSSIASVLITGVIVQKWLLRERYVDDRIAEIIKEVDAVSDLAVTYWENSKSQKAVTLFQPAPPHDNRKDKAMEAEILSRFYRVARMRSVVGDMLDRSRMQELFKVEGDLNRALTGGDFGSPDRICEKHRFDMIRTEATNYIGLMREARRARVDKAAHKSMWN